MSSINLQCERKSSAALTVKEENKINWEDSTQGKKSVEERRGATEVEPRHSTGGMNVWLIVDQWQLQKKMLCIHFSTLNAFMSGYY